MSKDPKALLKLREDAIARGFLELAITLGSSLLRIGDEVAARVRDARLRNS